MEEVIICRTRENDERFAFRVSLLDNTDRTVHDVSLSYEITRPLGSGQSPPRDSWSGASLSSWMA